MNFSILFSIVTIVIIIIIKWFVVRRELNKLLTGHKRGIHKNLSHGNSSEIDQVKRNRSHVQ